uniref:Uncharacterized protein n=1 Tax=Rhizophora mucronata TaxID=61149 RepID=A0A2P2K0R6_RHIMU
MQPLHLTSFLQVLLSFCNIFTVPHFINPLCSMVARIKPRWKLEVYVSILMLF